MLEIVRKYSTYAIAHAAQGERNLRRFQLQREAEQKLKSDFAEYCSNVIQAFLLFLGFCFTLGQYLVSISLMES